MHGPAACREAPLRRLHNVFGYGLRRWQRKEKVVDRRVWEIVKVATDGIKGIMREDCQQNATRQAACVPPPGLEHPLEAEAHSRKLRLQLSDTSTCLLSSGEEASLADTEEWEPTEGRSHTRRPRLGRRAKARARREAWEDARRNEASCNEGRGDDLISTLLACIDEDGFDEEQWDREGGCSRTSDLGSEEEAKQHEEERDEQHKEEQEDERPGKRQRRQAEKEIEEQLEQNQKAEFEELGQEPLEAPDSVRAGSEVEEPEDVWLAVAGAQRDAQGEVWQRSLEAPPAVETAIAAKFDELDKEDSACSEHEEPVSTESEEDEQPAETQEPWTHHYFEEVADGAKVLPSALVGAILSYKECLQEVDCETVEKLEEIEKPLKRLGKMVRKIEKQLSCMEDWPCPKHLRAVWRDLEEFLSDAEEGPSYRIMKMKEYIEEFYEDEADEEDTMERICGAWYMAQDGFEQILDLLHKLAGHERYKKNREASLKNELNERFNASKRNRSSTVF